jgi:hypothetical protein
MIAVATTIDHLKNSQSQVTNNKGIWDAEYCFFCCLKNNVPTRSQRIKKSADI